LVVPHKDKQSKTN